MEHDTIDGWRRRLDEEREETARLVAALTDELDGIIESVDHTNNDDEHDPDGSTNGYERAKATSLLAHARSKLEALDAARERVEDGTYDQCERCGGAIAPERLDALPATRHCTSCAR